LEDFGVKSPLSLHLQKEICYNAYNPPLRRRSFGFLCFFVPKKIKAKLVIFHTVSGGVTTINHYHLTLEGLSVPFKA
jgi:hypothetical protein